MDLNFAPEDEAFRDECRSFLAETLPGDVARKVGLGIQPTLDEVMAWHRELYDKGWIAPNWPEEWGGPGWTVTQKYIWDEEQALANAPRPIPFGLSMCGPVLMAFGTEQQKRDNLPRILSGERIYCQGYSEPGAGSDLAALKTRCEVHDDRLVINGQKIWTTAAHWANWIFCLVRTSSAGKRQEGISFVLIDMATPGIEVKPLITLEGLHEVNEVFFTDVVVPRENLVGEVDQGWTIAKYLLGHERMGGGALGSQKNGLRSLKEIAADQGLDRDGTFMRKVAEVEIELQTLEMQMLRMLAAVSADKEIGAESSMIKIRRTEIQQRLSELKMEAAAYDANPYQIEAMEHGWNEEPVGPDYANALAAKYFNDRKHTIFAGSNEIQRNIISKRVLGL